MMGRKRALLTDKQASEIFKLKCAVQGKSQGNHLSNSTSVRVSSIYGISPKAIRVCIILHLSTAEVLTCLM